MWSLKKLNNHGSPGKFGYKELAVDASNIGIQKNYNLSKIFVTSTCTLKVARFLCLRPLIFAKCAIKGGIKHGCNHEGLLSLRWYRLRRGWKAACCFDAEIEIDIGL